MFCYVIILICSVWMVYNFFTLMYDIPFISLFSESSGFIAVINGVALKWSVLFGVFGLSLGVLGLVKLYKDSSMDVLKRVLMVFYIIFSVLLLL